jgi:hypothetical protein
MIRYFKLKRYNFLVTLKKEFSNPKKEVKAGDVYLTIDSDKYEKIMDNNYGDYLKIVKDLYHYTGIDFYFQKYPNFRYNTKDDSYPVWHSDRFFNHNKDEINVMIPITKKEFGFEVVGWFSHILNLFPLSVLNSKFGKWFLDKISLKINDLNEIMVFDSYHIHTASNRKSFKNPRLSIDLRLLPIKHSKNYKLSKRNIPMKPGYYFSEKPISEYIK